jgi:hypothetical protein
MLYGYTVLLLVSEWEQAGSSDADQVALTDTIRSLSSDFVVTDQYPNYLDVGKLKTDSKDDAQQIADVLPPNPLKGG